MIYGDYSIALRNGKNDFYLFDQIPGHATNAGYNLP